MSTVPQSPNSTSSEADNPLPKHRIRTIRGIHIRNLTRFPHRDTLASALQQSVDPSFAPRSDGHLVDDIDIALARRRSRRISSTSIATVRSLKAASVGEAGGSNTNGSAEDASRGGEKVPRARRMNGASSTLSQPPVSAPPTIRRQRSSSRASIISLSTRTAAAQSQASSSPTDTQFSPFSAPLDQHKIEEVVASRLVKTFLTLHLPSPDTPASPSPSSLSPPSVLSPTRSLKLARPTVPSRQSSTTTPAKRTAPSRVDSRQTNHNASSIPSSTSSGSMSPSTPRTSTLPPTSSSSRSLSPSTPRTSTLSTPHRPLPPPSPPSPPPTDIPFYLSPFHYPSTNPSFPHLDPGKEFADWADTSREDVVVSVWGRKVARKEQGGEGEDADADDSEWEVIVQWWIDMRRLEPLPTELATHPDRLPPNTLLFSLSPYENIYHLPLPPSTPSRPPSPSTGYQSDGELDAARTRSPVSVRAKPRSVVDMGLREGRMKRTAGFPDLVSLVTLQACVTDTRESVNAIAASAAKILDDSTTVTSLRREANQRDEWLRTIRQQTELVRDRCRQVSADICQRAKELEERRKALSRALEMQQELEAEQQELEKQHDETKATSSELNQSIPSIRSSLVRTLDFLFPIEPLSSGDLLFTILNAPLPVPIGPSDPTPPLSLPGYPTVSEDSVSSALGYAAEVVQLLAVYLGAFLPYPITYAGSRSLIKDPISEMQGPRVFPLYSKGVDTYRFEYGVFLLNKDIELLMMRRNLRALDFRHTLPNLKNLILTLTTRTTPHLYPRKHHHDQYTESDLEGSEAAGQEPVTPSTNSSSRKPFLSPLAAMLRSRYAGSNFLKPANVEAVTGVSPTEAVLAEIVSPQPSPEIGSRASWLANGSIAGSEEASTGGDESNGVQKTPEDGLSEKAGIDSGARAVSPEIGGDALLLPHG